MDRKWVRLRQAAWIAIAIHFIAGLSMYFVLGRGLETNPDLANRLKFITEHRTEWIAAWIPWNLAALAILNFFSAFASAHTADNRHKLLLKIVVIVAAIGVLFDLSAEAIEMILIPPLAKDGIDQAAQFLTVDRMAVLLTGCIANSLYTAATAICIICTRTAYPLWIFISGVAVVISGTAISIGSITDSIPLLFWSNALMIPSILNWQLGVALTKKPDA